VTDPSPTTQRPELDEGGPPDLAHYARNDELVAARKEGRAVKALCGTLFRPHRDPSQLPVCVVCVDLAAAYRR
jgi:Protein of unknown function (DUF3039)